MGVIIATFFSEDVLNKSEKIPAFKSIYAKSCESAEGP